MVQISVSWYSQGCLQDVFELEGVVCSHGHLWVAAPCQRQDHIAACGRCPPCPCSWPRCGSQRLSFLSTKLPGLQVCAFYSEVSLESGPLTSKPRKIPWKKANWLHHCSYNSLVRMNSFHCIFPFRTGWVCFLKSCLCHCLWDGGFPEQGGCLINYLTKREGNHGSGSNHSNTGELLRKFGESEAEKPLSAAQCLKRHFLLAPFVFSCEKCSYCYLGGRTRFRCETVMVSVALWW